MGQKVHPNGIRLGIVKTHRSVWFAEGQEYADKLISDLEVREFLQKKLKNASVSRIDIQRPSAECSGYHSHCPSRHRDR